MDGVFESIVKALALRKLLFDRNKDATGALKKHGEQAQLIKVILTGVHVHVLLIYCHQLAYIKKHNGNVCIPDKANATIKHDFDEELYAERFFQRIKKYRHINFIDKYKKII